jgi:hypothetical protein
MRVTRKTSDHAGRSKIVFLFDVDNTLLDNDRIIADLNAHLRREVGPERARRYWTIFEKLRAKLGYADYLGALQQARRDDPHDLGLLAVSRFLVDYPFAKRLYPKSLDVIKHFRRWAPVALLSDGDVVFQPRKVADVEARYPAARYVVVDDKLAILAAIKKSWKSRVTTVFVRQGHYAMDPRILSKYREADVNVKRIGDLLKFDDATFARPSPSN